MPLTIRSGGRPMQPERRRSARSPPGVPSVARAGRAVGERDLLYVEGVVDRDAAADGAAVRVRGDDADVADLPQRLREGEEAGRVDAVVVGDEDVRHGESSVAADAGGGPVDATDVAARYFAAWNARDRDAVARRLPRAGPTATRASRRGSTPRGRGPTRRVCGRCSRTWRSRWTTSSRTASTASGPLDDDRHRLRRDARPAAHGRAVALDGADLIRAGTRAWPRCVGSSTAARSRASSGCRWWCSRPGRPEFGFARRVIPAAPSRRGRHDRAARRRAAEARRRPTAARDIVGG